MVSRNNQKKYKEELYEKGICFYCGDKLDLLPLKYCSKCKKKFSERYKARAKPYKRLDGKYARKK